MAFWGANLEYGPDFFHPSVYKGLVNDVQVPTLYLYNLYWDKLLNVLYYYYPDISWYGILLFAYSIINSILWSVVIVKISANLTASLRFIYLSILLLFWIDSLFYISFTRIPFYSIGVVSLYVLTSENLRFFSLRFLSITAFAVGAIFIRYESGIAAFVVLLPVILLMKNGKPYRLRKVGSLLLFLIIGLVGVFIHSKLYNQEQDQIANDFYQAHFNFFDSLQRMPTDNPSDSIRVEAMMIDFNADKDSLSLMHYDLLTIGHPFKIKGTEHFQQKLQYFKQNISLLKSSNQLMLKSYVLLILLSIALMYRNRKLMMFLFVHQMWGWIVLILMLLLTKYTDRVTQPIFTLMSFSCILSLHYSDKNEHLLNSRITKVFLTFLIGLCMYYSLFRYRDIGKIYQSVNFQNGQILETLSRVQKQENKDIIFTNDAFELLSVGLFSEVSKNELVVYSYDNHLNYMRNVQEAINAYIGGSSIIDFYDYLNKNKNSNIILATNKRIDVYKSYFKLLYGYDLILKDITKEYLDEGLYNNYNQIRLFQMEYFEPITH